jgi:catechol 2,3-dioxygenase-like lactoylglutathione lyase family enzyme
MHLDHVTIVTPDCEAMRRFFIDFAGMTQGARPPFGVGGYWLYLDHRPVVHLVASASAPAAPSGGRPATRIDHLALRVQTEAEWRALLDRLHAGGMPYQMADVPLAQEKQLFVQLAPGVVVEFVTAASRV